MINYRVMKFGVQYLMFTISAAIICAGFVAFVFGLWTLSDTFVTDFLIDNSYIISALLLTINGFISILIALFTSYCVHREYHKVLKICVFLLIISAGLSIIGGVLAFQFTKQFDDQIHHKMVSTVTNYTDDSAIKYAWDKLQREFNCCGVSVNELNGYYIYVRQSRHHFGDIDTGKVPESCCRYPDDWTLVRKCTLDPTNAKYTFHEDCFVELKNFVTEKSLISKALSIYSCCLLSIGVVFTVFQIYAFKKVSSIAIMAGQPLRRHFTK